MNISPEPDWEEARNCPLPVKWTNLRGTLRAVVAEYTIHSSPLTTVCDKQGNHLGSYTPEWFLSLDRRHQLRFLSVAKRMHDTGVDR